MTDDEARELAELKENIQRQKNNYFELSRTIARANERTLETMGFKGKPKGEAILFYFERISRDIEKALKAHERRWPS